jgi:hypothetical protein
MTDLPGWDDRWPRFQPINYGTYRSPRAGHGTVWVNTHDGTHWDASWQDGPDRVADSPEGTREEAIAWALRVTALKRLIFSEVDDDWLPLEPRQSRTSACPIVGRLRT